MQAFGQEVRATTPGERPTIIGGQDFQISRDEELGQEQVFSIKENFHKAFYEEPPKYHTKAKRAP